MTTFRMQFERIKEFFILHRRDTLVLSGILASLFFLHYLRITTHAFGISLGYAYLLVIIMGAIGFGFWGGLSTATISSLIFLYEVLAYQDFPLNKLVQTGMYWRFLGYSAIGGILGYYVSTEQRQKILLQNLANTDPVTGLHNYRFFCMDLDKTVAQAKRYGHVFSLAILDLDNFKGINDTYGHLVADDLLKKFAGVLKENLRKDDTLARYGGDEFLLLLPRQTWKETHEVLNRILEQLKSVTLQTQGGRLVTCSLTFSAGIASFPHNAGDAEHLMVTADDALYWAKQSGRNRIVDAWGPLLGNDFKGSERRTVPRFMMGNKTAKQFLVEKDKTVPARTVTVLNLSLLGALFETPCTFAPGEDIDIIFAPRDKLRQQNPIRIKATVQEIRRKSPEKNAIRVVFKSIEAFP